MFIRSARLFLRPIFPEDWRAIFDGIADERIVHMLARAPWPYTEDDARAFCNQTRDPAEFQFAITLPGSDGAPVIGTIGLAPEEPGQPHQLGYWLGRPWQRNGYAAEAAMALLETAGVLGVESAQAAHFVDNPASGRVLEKCGFVPLPGTGHIRCSARADALVPTKRYARGLAKSLRCR